MLEKPTVTKVTNILTVCYCCHTTFSTEKLSAACTPVKILFCPTNLIIIERIMKSYLLKVQKNNVIRTALKHYDV